MGSTILRPKRFIEPLYCLAERTLQQSHKPQLPYQLKNAKGFEFGQFLCPNVTHSDDPGIYFHDCVTLSKCRGFSSHSSQQIASSYSSTPSILRCLLNIEWERKNPSKILRLFLLILVYNLRPFFFWSAQATPSPNDVLAGSSRILLVWHHYIHQILSKVRNTTPTLHNLKSTLHTFQAL